MRKILMFLFSLSLFSATFAQDQALPAFVEQHVPYDVEETDNINLQVIIEDEYHLVSWQQSQLQDADYYIVQRSAEGTMWETVAVSEYSPDIKYYTFADNFYGDYYWYKIVEVGKHQYMIYSCEVYPQQPSYQVQTTVQSVKKKGGMADKFTFYSNGVSYTASKEY